jgi:hypothetical protein
MTEWSTSGSGRQSRRRRAGKTKVGARPSRPIAYLFDPGAPAHVTDCQRVASPMIVPKFEFEWSGQGFRWNAKAHAISANRLPLTYT